MDRRTGCDPTTEPNGNRAGTPTDLHQKRTPKKTTNHRTTGYRAESTIYSTATTHSAYCTLHRLLRQQPPPLILREHILESSKLDGQSTSLRLGFYAKSFTQKCSEFKGQQNTATLSEHTKWSLIQTECDILTLQSIFITNLNRHIYDGCALSVEASERHD